MFPDLIDWHFSLAHTVKHIYNDDKPWMVLTVHCLTVNNRTLQCQFWLQQKLISKQCFFAHDLFEYSISKFNCDTPLLWSINSMYSPLPSLLWEMLSKGTWMLQFLVCRCCCHKDILPWQQLHTRSSPALCSCGRGKEGMFLATTHPKIYIGVCKSRWKRASAGEGCISCWRSVTSPSLPMLVKL